MPSVSSLGRGDVALNPYYSELSFPVRETQSTTLGSSNRGGVEPRHPKGLAETSYMFERSQMKGLKTSGYWSLMRREVDRVAE